MCDRRWFHRKLVSAERPGRLVSRLADESMNYSIGEDNTHSTIPPANTKDSSLKIETLPEPAAI